MNKGINWIFFLLRTTKLEKCLKYISLHEEMKLKINGHEVDFIYSIFMNTENSDHFGVHYLTIKIELHKDCIS